MSRTKAVKKEVLDVLTNKDLGEALNHFKGQVNEESRVYNDVILLLSRFNSTENQINRGIRDARDAEVTFNQIKTAMLDYLDRLDESDLIAGSSEPVAGSSAGTISAAASPGPNSELKLFISYAHEDETYKDRLKRQLRVLERVGDIRIWDDRSMVAGMEWDKEIKRQLEESNVICLLVTEHFIDSDYCWSEELGHAIERHRQGTMKIIPIIITPVPNFGRLPFSHIVALPKDARPVMTWENPEEAWNNVGEEITRLVDHMKGR